LELLPEGAAETNFKVYLGESFSARLISVNDQFSSMTEKVMLPKSRGLRLQLNYSKTFFKADFDTPFISVIAFSLSTSFGI